MDQPRGQERAGSCSSDASFSTTPCEPRRSSQEDNWLAAKAKALELCKDGNYHEAEQICRQLIAKGFSDASVYCNLGNLCRLDGRKEEGLALLHESIVIDPSHANGYYNLGVAYQLDANDPHEAIRFYRKALALNRQLDQALRNQGIAFLALGRARASFLCMKRYFHMNPKEPELLLDPARLNQQLYTDVIAVYQQKLEADPSDSLTATCLGIALREARLLEQAAITNALSLSASPACAQLWLEQACCLMELGDMPQAIAACEEALKLEPENSGAFFMKSNALSKLGKLVEGMECVQQAIICKPDYTDALVNLAIFKRGQGLLEEAIALFQQAIALQATHPEAWEGLLFSYSIGGTAYRDQLLSALQAFWALPCEAQKATILRHSDQRSSSRLPASEGQAAAPRSKTRIGILSAEIGHHVVSTFLDSLLSHYNRKELEVEIIAPTQRKEAGTIALIRKVNKFINLDGKDINTAREILRARSYDLLIETSGHTAHNQLRLLSERCAPIQCHYIGFHATTGLPTIDYIIADHDVLPEALDPWFTETPWRLNRPWLACTPFEEPPPAATTAPTSAPVWGSFSQVAKIREDTLAYWASALCAVPAARLVIKDRNTVFEAVRSRILETLERKGVAGSRVSFLPWTKTWREHMLCHNQIDIALDTTPWSSSTTAFNALAMGVPLVAIRGQTMAARMSASIVAGLGRTEWICDTPQDFAATLAQLSSALPSLRAGKEALQREVLASQLFDGRHLTEQLESTFRQMMAKHERNLC